MTAVTVVRDSTASFLICRSRSSGRLIVVRRMHQIIRADHLDVNALAGLCYGAAGQFLAGTLMEYALPVATAIPPFDLDHLEEPAPNLTGVRGVGEGGTLGPAAVLANAVADALPLTPARLGAALTESR